MSVDWLKHLYGFSSGMYFTVAIFLLMYGLSYRKTFNWQIFATFCLLAVSFSCFGFFNIFFQQLFTDATRSLYSYGFLKFCAIMTPVSVLILTYVYIKSYTMRSTAVYKLIKKEIWGVYFLYASTIANMIAIYFVDDIKVISWILLLGFVLPCFGAARVAFTANERTVVNKGNIILFSGLLVIILTWGVYSMNHPDFLPESLRAFFNLMFALLTCMAGFFFIRYGYEEMWTFFSLQQLDKRDILSDITTGIHENQFSLHYQPQLDIQTGKVTAAEALIRWHHPIKGAISPVDYIPLAEESGLISDITKWVISTSIKQVKLIQAQGFELKISINFSPKDISQDVIAHLEKTLKKYDYPSKLVVIEITESQMVNSDDAVFLAAMERLNRLGVSVSIDDFGTGFSSLSHMQKLNVDELKIDQSFISDLDYHSGNYAIVYSTLQMARNLNLVSVAEGVEDIATLKILQELKCNFAQGYGIAKPMPMDELLVWLEKKSNSNTLSDFTAIQI